MSALDTVRQAIEAKTGPPRSGEYRCPAHDDRNPSLSINQGDAGVVLRCHRGCRVTDIMAAIGLPMSALYDDDPWQTTRKSNGLGPEIARFIYENADGEPIFSVTRHEPKTFRQWRPDGRGGWAKGAKGIDKPLYHLPEVLDAIEKGETVYVAEGEKDVEALRREGLVATTNPMGAQGEEPGKKWKPEYTETLAKAAAVRVIADDDEAGHTHARFIASELREAGCPSVEVYRPHEGHKDIAEHLGAKRSLEELRPLFLGDLSPEIHWVASKMLTIDDVLALEPPEPLIGDWLDVGMLATMPGKYGSLKSFLAMSMCFSVATGVDWLGQKIHNVGPVVYCSLEGDYTLGPRYRGWMERHGIATPPANFHTWASSLNLLDQDEINRFCAWLAQTKPLLVVIDTYSRATPGADENAKPDVSKAIRAFEQMRSASGGTILTTHHTGHNASGRGRGFSGLEDDIDVVLPVLGQWKDRRVQLTSAKQKARENPESIWVGLELTEGGHPVVVPAIEPEADSEDLRSLILAKVRRYPGELTKSHFKDGEYKNHPGYLEVKATRQKVRDQVDLMVADGTLKGEMRGRNQYLHPPDWTDDDLF